MQTENNYQATDTNQSEPDMSKWYNDKITLWLSILLWPVFLYGAYKTQVLSKKTKNIIGCAFIFILIMGALNKKGSSDGGDSTGKRLLHQSSWDNSVPLVESYIKKGLNDPGSYESVKWGEVGKNDNGTYYVLHTFRAKNGFGGTITQLIEFTIDSDGQSVISARRLK
jgi:hypothetical protein